MNRRVAKAHKNRNHGRDRLLLNRDGKKQARLSTQLDPKEIPWITRFLNPRCRRCGELLTSYRSIKKGIGQRCWRIERGLPPLPYQRYNNDSDFVVSGSFRNGYVQLKLFRD